MATDRRAAVCRLLASDGGGAGVLLQVSEVGAGAAALSGEPVLAAVPGAKIKAIAFDGLAVFDVRPVATLAERVFPGRGEEMKIGRAHV